jgi:anti-sigma factor RsiW
MACNEALRTQAYFDGELDAAASALIEQHLADCGACAGLLRDLQHQRDAVRDTSSYYRPEPEFRSTVSQLLDRESGNSRHALPQPVRGKPFWLGFATGIVPAALAAAVAIYVTSGPATEGVADDLVNAHLRSLVSTHLIDVASSDQHTVKPWFAGHADVSPPAVDFPQQDYRLIGGRADFAGGRRTAVVVYRHGAHIINVFAWRRSGAAQPDSVTRNGYHVQCWTNGDLDFCAVSDTAEEELSGLVRLLKDIKS